MCYADDNTPYATEKDLQDVFSKLEKSSDILLKWFKENFLKANPDKFHILLSTKNDLSLKLNEVTISNSNCEKLLGIKIDNGLTFESHVETLCKKASQKLNALSRIASSLKFDQRKTIMNAFITSQFSYAPVIWMFHSRRLNNRINHIHERALRIVYKDYTSSFDELLLKDNSFKIHHRNLQKLAIEMFKIKLDIAPEIMKSVFRIDQNTYSLRNNDRFKSRNVHTVQFGIETATFLGPKIWNSVPNDIKNSASLSEFKEKIKAWYPENCPCKLCKTYVFQVGYI